MVEAVDNIGCVMRCAHVETERILDGDSVDDRPVARDGPAPNSGDELLEQWLILRKIQRCVGGQRMVKRDEHPQERRRRLDLLYELARTELDGCRRIPCVPRNRQAKGSGSAKDSCVRVADMSR